jgi:hypothetical protein
MAFTNPEEYFKYVSCPTDQNIIANAYSLEILKKNGVADKISTVTIEQSAEMHNDNAAYKQSIKTKMTHDFAEKCMEKSTFTQLKYPARLGSGTSNDQVRVIGRCVVMSIDEFAQLVTEIR